MRQISTRFFFFGGGQKVAKENRVFYYSILFLHVLTSNLNEFCGIFDLVFDLVWSFAVFVTIHQKVLSLKSIFSRGAGGERVRIWVTFS